MTHNRQNGRHNPSKRSIQRWENEGGAIKHVGALRPHERSQGQNADTADAAGQVIDRLSDHPGTSKQREVRNRKLLEGPREFRDMRRDHRK